MSIFLLRMQVIVQKLVNPNEITFIGRKMESVIHCGLIILLYLLILVEKSIHVQLSKWL